MPNYKRTAYIEKIEHPVEKRLELLICYNEDCESYLHGKKPDQNSASNVCKGCSNHISIDEVLGTIRCKSCQRVKHFGKKIGLPPDMNVARLRCSKCESNSFMYIILKLQEKQEPAQNPTKPKPIRYKVKNCLACDKEIEESVFFHRPDSKYCHQHFHLNETKRPNFDTFGSREDFKKDSGRNWSNATKPKF